MLLLLQSRSPASAPTLGQWEPRAFQFGTCRVLILIFSGRRLLTELPTHRHREEREAAKPHTPTDTPIHTEPSPGNTASINIKTTQRPVRHHRRFASHHAYCHGVSCSQRQLRQESLLEMDLRSPRPSPPAAPLPPSPSLQEDRSRNGHCGFGLLRTSAAVLGDLAPFDFIPGHGQKSVARESATVGPTTTMFWKLARRDKTHAVCHVY